MIVIHDWVLYCLLAVACACGATVRVFHYRLVAHRLVMVAVIAKNTCQVGAYSRIAYNLYANPHSVDRVVLFFWTMYLMFYIGNIILNLMDIKSVWNKHLHD